MCNNGLEMRVGESQRVRMKGHSISLPHYNNYSNHVTQQLQTQVVCELRIQQFPGVGTILVVAKSNYYQMASENKYRYIVQLYSTPSIH